MRKLNQSVDIIVDILGRENISIRIRIFAKINGCFVALNLGMWIAPVFRQRLEIEMLRMNHFNFEKIITLSEKCIHDLKWWLENIQHFPKPVHRPNPESHLY